MARQSSGTGRGGRSFQDRELAAKVRTKALDDIYSILNEEERANNFSDLKKQMLLKMSTTILPRLNEHTGADGGAMVFMPAELLDKHGIDTSSRPIDDSEGPA